MTHISKRNTSVTHGYLLDLGLIQCLEVTITVLMGSLACTCINSFEIVQGDKHFCYLTLQTRRLKHTEAKDLVQGHTTGMRKS